MELEVREQPAVLASNAARYLDELKGALAGGSFEMVLLAARGSSDNAALFAPYLVEVHLRIPASLAATWAIPSRQRPISMPVLSRSAPARVE